MIFHHHHHHHHQRRRHYVYMLERAFDLRTHQHDTFFIE
jgi:hypothetical protein